MWGCGRNEKFDQIMKEAQSTLNDKTRAELYRQSELIIAEEAPLIPIFYSPLIKVINPAVGGFPMHNPQDYVYTKELYIQVELSKYLSLHVFYFHFKMQHNFSTKSAVKLTALSIYSELS